MKKLMIALGVVALAVSANAAAVTWSSGALKTPANADGGWSSTAITSGTATGYFWIIDSATYNSLYNADASKMIDNVMGKYAKIEGNSVTITDSTYKTPTTATTAITYKDDGGYTAGDTAYAAIIYVYNDGTAGASDYYIANVGSWTFASSSNKTVGNMALKLGGTSTTDLGGWQSVPEPTSGLLMLLGLAGLALKRKRA